MPKRKRGASRSFKSKRRRYGRKRRTRKRRALIGLPSGITMPRLSKMRYSETVDIVSSAGGLGSYIFRANSIFDPNFTGTGHQPMAHDTYSTLFDHYMVLGSKITVVCTSDTVQTNPYTIGCYLTDGSAAPYTNTSEYIEAKKGTWRQATGRQATPIRVMSKFSAKKFFNVKDPKDNKATLGAKFGQNPTDGAYFVVWFQNNVAATDTLHFRVVVDYICAFFEPKDLAQS